MDKPDQDPFVVIIVLNWNGCDDTLACLSSLSQLSYTNFQVVVVDNASTDGSVDKIKSRFPDQIILKNNKNLGYAAGNNRGIRWAMENKADYIWILNNDTEVNSNSLTELIDRVQFEPEIGICGSTLVYHNQRDRVQAYGGGKYLKYLAITRTFGDGNSIQEPINQLEIEQNLDFVSGASMLVSTEFVKDIGLIAEDYFLYYEEVDWALRSKESYKLGYAPKSIVYHKEGASIQKGVASLDRRSMLSDYYQIRNRLKVTWKFFSHLYPVIWFTLFGVLLKRMINGEWHRCSMILKIMAGIETAPKSKLQFK